MGSSADYYRLLHVRDDAPIEVIRSSYRTLMKTLGAHPDLGGDEGSARAINEAWAVLSDEAERARYDATRALSEARDRTSASEERVEPSEEPVTSPAAADDSDRRTISRLKRDARITWSTEDGRCQSAAVRDLSPRGMSFVTRMDLSPETPLEIRNEALYARAIVRNARRLEGDQHLVGVEFLTVRFHDPRGTFISRSA